VEIKEFQKKIWKYYKKDGRHDLLWRKTADPYKILVSEVMLQQTQVDRVIPKYKAFLKAFPTAKKLAEASNAEVLKLWSGLGYNRRALYLKRTAESIVKDFKGTFPKTAEELERLPGVGPYTARAIATFSYNASYILIETNIRTVFLYEFFPKEEHVSDIQVLSLIEATLPRRNPREWFWAVMDYGSHLKKTIPNPSRKSKHYIKQSTFAGSVRQMRGQILKILTSTGPQTRKKLASAISKKDQARFEKALDLLTADGFIIISPKGRIQIS
jgi:A/G-specific adenine glycosylase